MKMAPQMIAEEWGILDPNQNQTPVDPIVYTQSISPEYPEITTPNMNDVFKATTNALVKQFDALENSYSPPPQIPVEQPNLARIALIGVGMILIYKLIFKKG